MRLAILYDELSFNISLKANVIQTIMVVLSDLISNAAFSMLYTAFKMIFSEVLYTDTVTHFGTSIHAMLKSHLFLLLALLCPRLLVSDDR